MTDVSLLAPEAGVHVYSQPMSNLRALYLLRQNISGLLSARRETQAELAFALGHGKSWINKFLNGDREVQLKDLDRIADFFGIATYQLFQPGITPLTERRHQKDRRSGHDRRVGHSHRLMAEVAATMRRTHPRQAEKIKKKTGTDES